MNRYALLPKSLLAVMLVFASTQGVFAQDESAAQDEAAALEKAHAAFKSTLNEVNNLFYKESKTDAGLTFYTIMWEMDGETSKIFFELRELGNYQGEKVFGVLAYTIVAQSEGSMPPAVIKAVTTKNESTMLGAFSMPESFDKVFMNFSGPSDTMTAGQVWMVCAYLHGHRIGMKKEIEELLAASGR